MLIISTDLLASIALQRYDWIQDQITDNNYRKQNVPHFNQVIVERTFDKLFALKFKSVKSIEQYDGWTFIYIIFGLPSFQAFMMDGKIPGEIRIIRLSCAW